MESALNLVTTAGINLGWFHLMGQQVLILFDNFPGISLKVEARVDFILNIISSAWGYGVWRNFKESIFDGLFNSFKYLKPIRKVQMFKCEWERCVVPGHPFQRCFQMVKGPLLYLACYLSAKAIRYRGLMRYYTPSCLLDWLNYDIFVPR